MKLGRFKILFIVLIISYFLIYSFFGFNDGDDGYILALSWRVFYGEIPYKDFFSIRPPLPLFFHTLPLYFIPDNYQIIFERFLFYVLMALSSLFCSLALDKVFTLKTYQISPYLLATVGFVFSVHNFPPMPWYTVDGIFFAMLGIFVLIRFSSFYSIVFGMLFLFFSALCKQPFYLVPLAGIAYIVITYSNRRKSVVSVLTLILLISVFVILLYKQEALSRFVYLTSGSTEIGDLLSAGIIRYISFSSIYIILPIGFWIIISKMSNINKSCFSAKLVPYLFISFLLFYPLSRFCYSVLYKDFTYSPINSPFFRDDTAIILFVLSTLFLIANIKIEKKWMSLLFMLLISWCVSISWGYQTPALFSTPLLFCFFLISIKYFGIQNINKLIVYTLLIGTITYYIAYQKPYCNPVRQDLKYEVSDIFPKLKFIKVGSDTHDKYHEFKSLINKYGTHFKTLPGMPLSNYLTNTKSPINLDWAVNGETNNNNIDVLKVLMQKKPIIFMEKEPQLISVSNSEGKFNSSVTYYIKSNWVKIDSTLHFDIYRCN